MQQFVSEDFSLPPFLLLLWCSVVDSFFSTKSLKLKNRSWDKSWINLWFGWSECPLQFLMSLHCDMYVTSSTICIYVAFTSCSLFLSWQGCWKLFSSIQKIPSHTLTGKTGWSGTLYVLYIFFNFSRLGKTIYALSGSKS